MLFVIDVGNTNSVLGLFREKELVAHWRLTTDLSQTADEYGIQIRTLFHARRYRSERDQGPDDFERRSAFEFRSGGNGEGSISDAGLCFLSRERAPAWRSTTTIRRKSAPTGLRTASRPSRSTAALAWWWISARRSPLTRSPPRATTWAGSIAPGLGVSAEALVTRTARLPRVEVRQPEKLIGTSTVGSMQSGLYYGSLALMDGILERLREVLGTGMRVIATGGEAALLADASRFKPVVDANLTLGGPADHF